MTQAWRMLTALAAGLALNAARHWAAWPGIGPVTAGAEAVGGL